MIACEYCVAFTVSIDDLLASSRTLISDVMSAIGILGIVLMIIENELSFSRMNDSDTQASWFLKLIITLTTAVLVGLIFYYHRLDLDLFCNQNSLNDWRIGLSLKRVAWILLEIGICVVHPVPRLYPSEHPPPINHNATDPVSLGYTPTDVGLGLPSKWHPSLRCTRSLSHCDCQCFSASTYSVARPCFIPIWCAMDRCAPLAISIMFPSISFSFSKPISSSGPPAACSSSAPYRSSSEVGVCERATIGRISSIKPSAMPCGCSLSPSVLSVGIPRAISR